jgi:excisionase family DNA binding protein
MQPEYISTKQLSEMLGIHKDTLQRWRSAGDGPQPTRMGRIWKYNLSEVQRWLHDQQIERGETNE